MPDQIVIRGARLHNLKNVSLSLPKNQLIVLTGVSGSGKSTLGFDILLKEGQRQYIEALGMAPYGLAKAPVEALTGLSPTVSVSQYLTNRSPRSTVGTTTDVYTYLRILFARLGRRPCPACGQEISPAFDSSETDWPAESLAEESASAPEASRPCPHCGAAVPELSMASFSFNKPEGACPTCSGLGTVRQADLGRLVDAEKSLLEGAVVGWNRFQIDYHAATLKAAALHYGFEFYPERALKEYSPAASDLLFYGVESPLFRRHFPESRPPATVRAGRFEGIATSLLRRYAEHIHAHVQEGDYQDKLEELLVTGTCPDCNGTRLRPESRAVTVAGRTIVDLTRLPLEELGVRLEGYKAGLGLDERLIAGPVLAALAERLAQLVEVGAGYLTPERDSPSLSAGEAQRLRLAGLLGSSLSGLLYVFDEPTIGLHARDTQRLIAVLRRLRDLGNTVLVIEHDLEMIAAADYVVDFGPGAGREGGQVVAAGTPAEIRQASGSLTGDYLAGRATLPIPPRRRPAEQVLTIRGARHHNLKGLTVHLPLGRLVAVTGVSGSGKSSLIFDLLDRALRRRLYGAGELPGEHAGIDGVEALDKVITIDQEHLARAPRSNAATYSEVFGAIRQVFAEAPEARQDALSARDFSFNLPGGRCERCEGTGVLTVSMQLLPDAEVICPVCRGRRFNPRTLAVRYREHDISQVLDLTVAEALALFAEVPSVRARLQVLADVGLGYLQLGQPATTLSGGEAQRVKLAKELGRRGTGRTLYLFDEPTTGLHLADTARLLGVLERLVDGGNSVIVVEHNLELVKAADWVIDLGPEGGAAGGQLVAQGTPEEVAGVPGSYTGQALKTLLSLPRKKHS